MAKNLFAPLFGDYSIIGRAVGFVFRSLRIILGSLVILLCLPTLGGVFVLWIILPFLAIYFGGIWGVAAILLLWGLYTVFFLGKPEGGIFEVARLEQALTREARRVFSFLVVGRSGEFLDQLLGHSETKKILARLALDPAEFRRQLLGLTLPAFGVGDVLEGAAAVCQKMESFYIEVSHLLLAVLGFEEVQKFLRGLDLEYADALESVLWIEEKKNRRPKFFWEEDFIFSEMGGLWLGSDESARRRLSRGRDWRGRPTPTLDKYSEDLTLRALRGELPLVVGKERAMQRLIEGLSRTEARGVFLIGGAGSGKTTLVKGLAQRIIKDQVLDSLRFKRLVSLDIAKVTGGAEVAAEANRVLAEILEEAKRAGNVIIFVDEAHNLAASFGEGEEAISAFSAFEPYISRGLPFIGATSTANFKKYVEPNTAFVRTAAVVELPEASEREALAVLKVVAWEIELAQRVVVSLPALGEAIALSKRYITERVFPDKAVSLIDEAAAVVKSLGRGVVTPEDIVAVVSAKTKIPIGKITQAEAEKLLRLEEEIHRRIVDQEPAVKAVSDALRRARVAVRSEGRPIASFLFVGPTGVGKTETARALADIYFGGQKNIVRLDMSEYQERDTLSRLIGAPPGEEGARAGGQLTEAVRRNPYTLVLLDELEKAHPDILLLFLQVLEDGRLTDSLGHTVDFSQTIIIATSNVGTRIFQRVNGSLSFEEARELVFEETRRVFRPEFLNRFSGIIVFRPLSPAEVRVVAELLLAEMAKRLSEQGIIIEPTAALLDWLAKEGYDPKWGARPLRRLIEEKVEAPLAKKVLAGEIRKGDKVTLSCELLSL